MLSSWEGREFQKGSHLKLGDFSISLWISPIDQNNRAGLYGGVPMGWSTQIMWGSFRRRLNSDEVIFPLFSPRPCTKTMGKKQDDSLQLLYPAFWLAQMVLPHYLVPALWSAMQFNDLAWFDELQNFETSVLLVKWFSCYSYWEATLQQYCVCCIRLYALAWWHV